VISITDRVFVETKYTGANVGVVMTLKGPVLIDTPMLPKEARELREQLRQMSELDIAIVIYTHEHFDHVMGSAFLTNRTIAHDGAMSAIGNLQTTLPEAMMRFLPDLFKENKEMLNNVDIVLPQITFSKELALHMGDRTLKLTYVGGHSPASIVVYVPEDQVLFAGDNVVTGQLPFTAHCQFGPWIEVLNHIIGMEIDTIIPGHGEICGKEGVRKISAYFETMRDQVRNLFSAGANKEEVIHRVHLNKCLPVPLSREVAEQVALDISLMYDQIEQGLL
jgi:cyclase